MGSIFYSDKKTKEEDILFDRQPYDHGPLSQYETAIGLNSAPTSLKTGQSSSLPPILNQYSFLLLKDYLNFLTIPNKFVVVQNRCLETCIIFCFSHPVEEPYAQ